MRFIHLAALLGALEIMRAADKGGATGSGTKATAPQDLDAEAMRKRQKQMADATLAEQAAQAAAALAAETDTELTTVEHSGKRTGEPDKPDAIEDQKVGEGYKTEEVQTTEVTRPTVDGEQVVDIRVTSPEPDPTTAAAIAGNPEGSTFDPRLAAGATLPGTAAQQRDAQQVARDSGGTATDQSNATAGQGEAILPDGSKGKAADKPKDNGPGSHSNL
jgi:hypothetical protein